MYLFELQFSSFPVICPGVGLLDHVVALFLLFSGTSILFSIVAAPIYILKWVSCRKQIFGFAFLSRMTIVFNWCRLNYTVGVHPTIAYRSPSVSKVPPHPWCQPRQGPPICLLGSQPHNKALPFLKSQCHSIGFYARWVASPCSVTILDSMKGLSLVTACPRHCRPWRSVGPHHRP